MASRWSVFSVVIGVVVFFHGSLCLWCGFKRDDTYQCRQLFCSLRNRISHYANLKCDAETLRFYLRLMDIDSRRFSAYSECTHSGIRVSSAEGVISMTKLQESLILLTVAVRRMRNRAVGVLNLHLRSSKSFFSPRSFLSDGVRSSRKIKSLFLFDSAAVLVTNSVVT